MVDVTVTDRHGDPVKGLKQDDFVLREDGAPQVLRGFEEHRAESAAPASSRPREINTFTNRAAEELNGPLNVLLLDTLNTPVEAQQYLRLQISDYLRSAKQGSRIAIFGLGTRLYLLQSATDRPELLRAAIESSKASPQMSPLGADSSPQDDSFAGSLNADDPDLAQVSSNWQQFEAEQTSLQSQMRVQYTLSAMNDLARYLAGFSGRKNLIWFSGSFPVNILPDGDLQNPFAVAASSEAEFRETSDLLARSQVAVYPMDVRGLMPQNIYDASSSGSKMTRNPTAASRQLDKLFQDRAEGQGAMRQMAEATGGKAIVNSNGLADALAGIVRESANYYTIHYSPANRRWDGRFRSISVQLQQKGYHLSYRRGYYADAQSPSTEPAMKPTVVATPVQPLLSPIQRAMLWSAAPSTQIALKASVREVASMEEQPAVGNEPAPGIKAPFRRVEISLAAGTGDIVVRQMENKTVHASLEFIAAVYDAKGALVNTVASRVAPDLSEASYRRLLAYAVPARMMVSVPAKGTFTIRVAVHDLLSDRIGSVMVSLSGLK